MISITRAGNSEMASGSRVINELSSDKYDNPISIKRIIVVRRIDPEEFEDEVSDMGEREEDNMTQEELDALESQIPAEVDNMSMEELGAYEEEDGIDGSTEGGEADGTDAADMTDEELAALEKEIPPEVDQLKDEDLEDDPDLESDEDISVGKGSEKESDDTDDKKEAKDSKPSKKDVEEAEEDLDEGVKLDEYI